MKRLTVVLMFGLIGSLGNRLYAADDDLFGQFIKDNRLDFIKRKPTVFGNKFITHSDAESLERGLVQLMEGDKYSQNDRSDIVARLVKKVNLHADIVQISRQQLKKTSQTLLQYFLETANSSSNSSDFDELKKLGALEEYKRGLLESGHLFGALKLVFKVGVKPEAEDLIYVAERVGWDKRSFDILVKYASKDDLESFKASLSNSSSINIGIHSDKLKLSVNGELSLRSEAK